MKWWEILLIIQGYRRRNVLQYQLQRIQAYAAAHCMSGDKEHKGPDGWLPLYVDKYITNNEPPISAEEVADLQAEMAALNAQIEQQGDL